MPKTVTNESTEVSSLLDSPAAALGVLKGTPPMIEAAERSGQRELVESEVVPVRMSPSREAYEELGFVFGKDVPGDNLFVEATLPKGWSRRKTDHPLWSSIVDAEGRERVSVMYKAAFYDRDASMSLVGRFDIVTDRADTTKTCRVVDKATGATLFTSPTSERSSSACYVKAEEYMTDHGLLTGAESWKYLLGSSGESGPYAFLPRVTWKAHDEELSVDMTGRWWLRHTEGAIAEVGPTDVCEWALGSEDTEEIGRQLAGHWPGWRDPALEQRRQR